MQRIDVAIVVRSSPQLSGTPVLELGGHETALTCDGDTARRQRADFTHLETPIGRYVLRCNYTPILDIAAEAGLNAREAEAYHRPQLEMFAKTTVAMVATRMTHVGKQRGSSAPPAPMDCLLPDPSPCSVVGAWQAVSRSTPLSRKQTN